jgi:chemotaxis protein methyltransferase CheR
MIQFKRINLMDPFGTMESFSIIFCRNVLIYFDARTQELVINRLADRLQPQGYLFVGHAEGLFAHNHPLHHVCPAVYQKRNEPRRPSP